MDLCVVRKEKNFTQKQLAEKVGVTRQMISAIERGSRPSPKVAQKIADELEFDWTLFFKSV